MEKIKQFETGQIIVLHGYSRQQAVRNKMDHHTYDLEFADDIALTSFNSEHI